MLKKSFPHELIGKEILVVNSTNHSQIGMRGKIVDETKSTLIIESEGNIGKEKKNKTLLKKSIVFRLGANGPVLEGKDLAQRSEERMKK
ncbi:MAG: ribonuclease P protein subunit [Nanoarchaeota archaeon]